MLTVSRRTRPALAGALVALLALAAVIGLALAPSAQAGTPATVTVRVLGPAPNYETLTALTVVTTTSAPVTRYGGSCSGTSAAGALEEGTHGDWEGTWNSEFNDYEVVSVDGHAYPFGAGLPYWSFWLNNKEAATGICEAELEPGEQVLFFPTCYGEEGKRPECEPDVLGIEAPATAEVGKPVTVTVERYNAKGERSPAAGVTVSGGGTSAEANSEGHAALTFSGDGADTLRATGAVGEATPAVPDEASICVHDGNDGTCGTPSTTNIPSFQVPGSSKGSTSGAPYTGPYALVAALTGIPDGHVYPRGDGPRVLSGTVSAHASVTSISLRLRRTYRGRCWTYNGSSERLQHVRCNRGSFFQIASGGDSFSYLLPSRLPPGRYVLDVAATDSVGNRTALDRGSSRIVFYVR
jgi:hypothetical protein